MQDHNSNAMNAQERRATSGLSLVFAFRMLGMFMVLPVLATYGQELSGATPFLLGLAIGAYGLTQAVLQIPFGMISDRIGRLPVIYIGLLIFAVGSVVAGLSESVWGVIAGRVLQGAGAISAAVMALLSDLTREQHRTKAMAFIGISIGISFAVAMVIGPLVTRAFGLSGLFWFTAAMAILGIFIIAFAVPKPVVRVQHRESGVAPAVLAATLRNRALLRLDLGIFVLHALLMASFIALPLALVEQGGLPKEEHWWVYLISLFIGFFSMVPFIIYGEKKRQMKRVFIGAISVLLFSELFFWWFGQSLILLIIGTVIFFTAFNLLEATLPSLVSKEAPAGGKGTAMGVYSTSQFLGAAVGGMLGGWLFSLGGAPVVFAGCAALAALWLVFAANMQEPPYVTSMRFLLSPAALQDTQWLQALSSQAGVKEAVLVAEEVAVYVKFDTQVTDRATVEAYL
ncbi:MFS transporter [Denitrificimonas sp. JX-1]|uniref:MFS transporter n=1 Tax=Denitrificimonas halotolerans TaxID=3098930 RepID=A0ABU5GQP6_9GAMM|nr:MFS transporter [Denitrificimonas sp. JX-1]MDY7219309.1 MFS transporter [Denitrificimonas sp. JX-1]